MAQERAKMPVVSIPISRLLKFTPGRTEKEVLEMLPFTGLDIEGVDDGVIRVEYNPNRPDFSSEYGIFRALRGILGLEKGAPKLTIKRSGLDIFVGKQLKNVRPYIVALVANGGPAGAETIKQLVSMQEDLHDGIGRRRRKASIGLHNFDAIRFPLHYTVVDRDYSFVPLGETSPKSVSQIIEESEVGRQYSRILSGTDKYPIILDEKGSVLSFPPIINSDLTKVDENTRNLFVEVTATSKRTAADVLAIIAITLHDAGFKIESVNIRDGKSSSVTPEYSPSRISVDCGAINSVLGLNLEPRQIASSLQRCRLDARVTRNYVQCEIPRYRTDISDPVDLAEEVAIGYGVYRLEPSFPPSTSAGSLNKLSGYFSAVRESLIGLGMMESLNFSLSSSQVLYDSFGRSREFSLSVDGSKSAEHEILRDSLVPSVLQALSRNVHEEYPQRFFEIGKVFHSESKIRENWAVAAGIAHAESGYTEVKSAMEAFLRSAFGKKAETVGTQSQFFIEGRCAAIAVEGKSVGIIGEITPLALENFRLRMPVSAFEMDLSELLNLPQ
jgi:phenylalanyl-tRNA synthetase beta chain